MSISNTNENTLFGVKKPLFNHVTKLVHGIEPVLLINLVPLELSRTTVKCGVYIFNTLQKFCA